MSDDYLDNTQREAEEIAKTLRQVYELLGNDKLNAVYKGDATELRSKMRDLLGNINTNINELAKLDSADVFDDDPTLARRKHILIEGIETAKIDFEFEIVPALEKLTKQVIENSKQDPPAKVDDSTLPPSPSGEKWTIQKVLDTAGNFVDQAARAGSIITKAYTLAKALGLIMGIPIP